MGTMKLNTALQDTRLNKFLTRRASSVGLLDFGAEIQNFQDTLFNLLKKKNSQLTAGKLWSELEREGLWRTDPRLTKMNEFLKDLAESVRLKEGENISMDSLYLDKDTFLEVVKSNLGLISRAFRANLIIPEFFYFQKTLEKFYVECKSNRDGKMLELISGMTDEDAWAVSVCTVDGQRCSFGDCKTYFTMQSCSKVFAYALAHSELGKDVVHQYVGQEPSGRDIREMALDSSGRPHNPMIDSGAIIVCSLLQTMVHPEMRYSEKFEWLRNAFQRIAGNLPIEFNNAAFIASKDISDGNFAQAFYMRENKCFPPSGDLKACMDLYLQSGSMEVTCETMAVMAATLANGGICPLTDEQVLRNVSVRDTLSLMYSCGMDEYSGEFAFKVGLPAKSGTSGVIMVAVPNVMGLCVYSPLLDNHRNSVRGLQFCKRMVEVYNFHHYDCSMKHGRQKEDPRHSRVEEKAEEVVGLLFSAASGDATAMRRYHLIGMDMELKDYDGRTALHLSAAEGHLECVDYLLNVCHVSPFARDRWGHTAKDDAKIFGHNDVAAMIEQAEKCKGHFMQKMENVSLKN